MSTQDGRSTAGKRLVEAHRADAEGGLAESRVRDGLFLVGNKGIGARDLHYLRAELLNDNRLCSI